MKAFSILFLSFCSFFLFGIFAQPVYAQQAYQGDLHGDVYRVSSTSYISPTQFTITATYTNVGDTLAALPDFRLNFLTDADKVKVVRAYSDRGRYTCARVEGTGYFECTVQELLSDSAIIKPTVTYTQGFSVELKESSASSFSYSTDHLLKIQSSKYFKDLNNANDRRRILYHGKFTPAPLSADYKMVNNISYPQLSKSGDSDYVLNLKVLDLNDTGWLTANRPSYQIDFGNADQAVVSVSDPKFKCEPKTKGDGRRVFRCDPIPYTVEMVSATTVRHDRIFPGFDITFTAGTTPSNLDYTGSSAKILSNFWFTDTNLTNNTTGSFRISGQ